MNERDLLVRIDGLIEELIPLGTLESAALASILLATRAAVRDHCVIGAARAIWKCVDERTRDDDSDAK